MWRLIDDTLTDELAGPEWRKSSRRRDQSGSPSKKEKPGRPVISSVTAQPQQKTRIQSDAFEKSAEDRLRQMFELHANDELRQFVYQRLERLTKLSPDRLENLVQRHGIATVNALAARLGIDVDKMRRTVIFPSREFKAKNS